MELGFLFWFYLIGLGIATLQDLHRREIDDWLNLTLFFGGSAYIIFASVLQDNFTSIFLYAFMVLLLFITMNVFYGAHVFAGGDAKLLFALTPLFVLPTFLESLYSVFLFVMLLMVCGSIWGILSASYIYLKKPSLVNSRMKTLLLQKRSIIFLLISIGITLLGFIDKSFMYFGIVLLFLPLLYAFSRALEDTVMTRKVTPSKLREGDWLAHDVSIGKKIIASTFEGLTKKDLQLLKKRKKPVAIKEGIPFVPAFFMAYLFYYFLHSLLSSQFFLLF